ncbi:MAG: ABC transporter substrate-binding protein [Candidatus Binatia bacterium]|nr:ABC transporter substrate-binding protein [Candidatus Binatia bacterium]
MRNLLILVLLLSSCGGHHDRYAGFLRIADRDDVPTLDPAHGYDTSSWQFEDLIFETLVDYNDRGEFEPELAREWIVDESGTRYVFRLRDDATFSDGHPVTAEDVRFQLTRVLALQTGSPGREFFRSIRGADSCNAPGCSISGLTVQDDRVLEINLIHPDPLFLHKMALPFASAVPRSVVLQRGEDFPLNPVGSGPFYLAERVPGQRLVFLPNPFYDKQRKPRLQGIVRFVGVQDDLAWMRYRSGQLDVVSLPPAETPLVLRDPRLLPLLRSGDTLRTQYVGMNCRLAPFSDVRVRKAMNFAVDHGKLVALLHQRAAPARGVIPPTMPGFPAGPTPYPLDRDRARQLLREAGWGQGFQATLWLRNDETAMRIAQSLQQDWAAVGIDIRLKPLAWGPFLEAVRHDPRVQMFLLGWEADFPDPSNFLEVLFHSRQISANNHTYYSNRQVDELLDRAASVTSSELRLELFRQVEHIVVADAPWVFLYHPRAFVMVSPRVRHFRLHPWRPPRLQFLELANQNAPH